MKKFFIEFAGSNSIVEKNFSEYSVEYKSGDGLIEATFDGEKVKALSTKGKGKTADGTVSYYLYFYPVNSAGKTEIYYVKSNPEEIESAKKGFALYSVKPLEVEGAAEEDAIREAAAVERIEAGDDEFTEVPEEVAVAVAARARKRNRK